MDETRADSGFVGKNPAHNLARADLANRAGGVSGTGGRTAPGHVSASVARWTDSNEAAGFAGS